MDVASMMCEALKEVRTSAETCIKASSQYAGRLWKAVPSDYLEYLKKITDFLISQLNALKNLFLIPEEKEGTPTTREQEAGNPREDAQPISTKERADQIWEILTGESLQARGAADIERDPSYQLLLRTLQQTRSPP